MDQSSLNGPSDIFDYPDEPFQFGGAFHALGALTQEPARADLIGPPPPPERTPDLADVMAAAERAVSQWTTDGTEFNRDVLDRRLEELAAVVNAVRAASGQPPIGEPADLCSLCDGNHDRISRRDWDGCGQDCGPCPNHPAPHFDPFGAPGALSPAYQQCPGPGPEGE